MIYVNFSDVTKTVIVAVFGCAQDPEAYPNQGTVEASDPMWKAFYNSMPEQQYLPVPTAAS